MFEVSRSVAHVGGLADLGEIADLDAATALAVAAEARATADRAEAVLLAVAAHYADLHPDPARARDHGDEGEGAGDRLPGMERARVYGGEGCRRWPSSRRSNWARCWGSVRMRRRS
jgi:hypothetical protein